MPAKIPDIDNHPAIQEIHARIEAGDKRMESIETEIKKNTDITSKVHNMLVSGESGLKVLGALGKILAWAVAIMAGVATIIGVLKGKSS